jgi:mRNA-degrading endonuclease RelE of RelBE toxin-antitoxin system
MTDEPTKPPPVVFTPEFKRNLRQLAKKYRHIRNDLQSLLDELAKGSKPGDQITGIQHEVFKVRVGNSDARKGKSGGYRVIYHVKGEEAIVLITIYSKSDQADVSAAEIRRIIAAEARTAETDEQADQE